VGIDVSKGYVDVAGVNNSGSILGLEGRFDDTFEGRQSLRKVLLSLIDPSSKEPVEIKVGLESSGGLERNWLKSIRKMHPRVKCYLLNPLAVKRFGERNLHRSVTDRISARNIAHYIRLCLNPKRVPFEPKLQGPRTFYRHVKNEIVRCAEMKNELQCLLVSANPELVQYCRNGLPLWILSLLKKYPTARKLAKARTKSLTSIPYVTAGRAEKLIEGAKKTTASLTDSMTGITVESLSREILRQTNKIREMKSQLENYMKDDEVVRLWVTYGGIALWTAICLRLEFGMVDRFYSAAALVAFCGLDPVVHQSGDSVKNRGISKQGYSGIRAILYPGVLAAIRHNPVISEFYTRLRGNGKKHLQAAVACMRKTVTILYAMAISGKPFDPEYHEKLRRAWEEKRKLRLETLQNAVETKSDGILSGLEKMNANAGNDVKNIIRAPVSRHGSDRMDLFGWICNEEQGTSPLPCPKKHLTFNEVSLW